MHRDFHQPLAHQVSKGGHAARSTRPIGAYEDREPVVLHTLGKALLHAEVTLQDGVTRRPAFAASETKGSSSQHFVPWLSAKVDVPNLDEGGANLKPVHKACGGGMHQLLVEQGLNPLTILG